MHCKIEIFQMLSDLFFSSSLFHDGVWSTEYPLVSDTTICQQDDAGEDLPLSEGHHAPCSKYHVITVKLHFAFYIFYNHNCQILLYL